MSTKSITTLWRGAVVLAGKDLRNYFMSPLFYLIAGLCALTWTLLYFLGLEEFAQASQMSRMQGQGAESGPNIHFVVFARHISLVNLIMIFAVSAMSMRLFTEEKRGGTMPLLLTSPITATGITLGKFIAGTLAAWALVAISFLYPASLGFFAKFDWGPLLASYVGLLLVAATYVAVGMFASSLTDNTVLSVTMATILNIMLWFIGTLADAAGGELSRKIFAQMNFGAHFFSFIRGTVSLSSLAFFFSVIALMTFLTQRVVESNRWR